jgi:hypothetical protein
MKKNIHCPRCGFTTNHKGNLFQHFRKKKLCKPKFVKASRKQMIEEYDKYQQIYSEHINKIEKSIKLIPKKKLSLKPKSTVITYEPTIEELDEKEYPKFTKSKKLTQKLTKMINQSEIEDNDIKKILSTLLMELNNKQKNNGIVGNNNSVMGDNNITNSNNNNNVIIMVNSYGNEDLSHITTEDWNRIIKQNLNAVPALTKKIHLDEPKNHNVMLKSLDKGVGYKYNGDEWEAVPMQTLMEDLMEINADRLYDYIDTQPTSRYKHKKIMSVMDKLGDDDSPLAKKNMIDIKLDVYNAKNKILKSHPE